MSSFLNILEIRTNSMHLRYFYLAIIIILACALPSCKKSRYSTRPTYYQTKHPEQASKDKPKLTQPAVSRRSPKTLTFAELQEAKDYSVAIDNKAQIIVYLENMLRQCSDPNLLKEIYLELADLYFEQGSLEQASKLYASYMTLYPGSPYRAYVNYQAILCRFYSTFSADRDQTRTEDTFKLAQLYLELTKLEGDIYKEYSDDVTAIQKQCCKKLYDHEMDIFNFYYKKGNYKAAQVHLDEIKKTYITLLGEDVEPDLLALECTLAGRLGDTKTVAVKQAELQTKYPQVATIKLASNSLKTDHVSRF
jgi:outer membrane assembly lipoprotein YfiO